MFFDPLFRQSLATDDVPDIPPETPLKQNSDLCLFKTRRQEVRKHFWSESVYTLPSVLEISCDFQGIKISHQGPEATLVLNQNATSTLFFYDAQSLGPSLQSMSQHFLYESLALYQKGDIMGYGDHGCRSLSSWGWRLCSPAQENPLLLYQHPFLTLPKDIPLTTYYEQVGGNQWRVKGPHQQTWHPMQLHLWPYGGYIPASMDFHGISNVFASLDPDASFSRASVTVYDLGALRGLGCLPPEGGLSHGFQYTFPHPQSFASLTTPYAALCEGAMDITLVPLSTEDEEKDEEDTLKITYTSFKVETFSEGQRQVKIFLKPKENADFLEND